MNGKTTNTSLLSLKSHSYLYRIFSHNHRLCCDILKVIYLFLKIILRYRLEYNDSFKHLLYLQFHKIRETEFCLTQFVSWHHTRINRASENEYFQVYLNYYIYKY